MGHRSRARPLERCTEPTLHALVLAAEEARNLKQEEVDSEHVLLGLIRVQEGLAARVIESLDISVGDAREHVLRHAPVGEVGTASNSMRFTTRARQALERAADEADALDSDHLATHHVLLGLVSEREGIARGLLQEHGLDDRDMREAVLGLGEASEKTQARGATTFTQAVAGKRPAASRGT